MKVPTTLLAGIAGLVLVSCQVSGGGSSTAPLPSACSQLDPPPGKDQTEYTCPDAASGDRCRLGNVTDCTPTNRKRGTVPPGGTCMRAAWNPAAKDFELGSDCAPVARFASPDDPKGSTCVMESGPGAYCTHACEKAADCADLVRDGFAGECSPGGRFSMCLLTKK